MKRLSRRTWMVAALALYLTACYVYLYFNGKFPPDAKHLGLAALSYALVAAVWWLNRRREKADGKEKN